MRRECGHPDFISSFLVRLVVPTAADIELCAALASSPTAPPLLLLVHVIFGL